MINKLSDNSLNDFLVLLKEYHQFYKVMVKPVKAEEYFRDLMMKSSEGQVFLFQVDEKPVGFCTIYFQRNSLTCETAAYLHDLYVTAKFRKQGIARKLMNFSFVFAQTQGCTQLTWHTQPSNFSAQQLYDSLTNIKSTWISYGVQLLNEIEQKI